MVEQPIRNRQVVGSTPTLGSRFLAVLPPTVLPYQVLNTNKSLPVSVRSVRYGAAPTPPSPPPDLCYQGETKDLRGFGR